MSRNQEREGEREREHGKETSWTKKHKNEDNFSAFFLLNHIELLNISCRDFFRSFAHPIRARYELNEDTKQIVVCFCSELIKLLSFFSFRLFF